MGMAEFVTAAGPPAAPVLAVSGDLDIAAVDDFLHRAGALLGAGVLEVDLGAVTFIDSTGLGALVQLRRQADAAGAQVRLTNVPARVGRLLELTGLTGLLTDGPEP